MYEERLFYILGQHAGTCSRPLLLFINFTVSKQKGIYIEHKRLSFLINNIVW